MRAWTIQSPEVFAALQAGRVWRARERQVPRDWLASYRWMADQMREGLGPPTAPSQMPVWLWCTWRGRSRPKPDLRATGHLPRGTRGVRIELNLDEARVLRSDFELWHYVMNGWYLPRSAQDERDFERRPDGDRIAASWRRIFDMAWEDRRYVSSRGRRAIQGVCWELRPADVTAATPFVAR
ncbi:MAG: DUF3841 domain-containing protein [Burkholderiales bacterium]